MTKISLSMKIEPEEIAEARDMLKDVVEAFEFPEYELSVEHSAGSVTDVGGGDRGVIDLPAEDETFAEYVSRALPDFARLDDEEEDETDPCIVLPGMVLELANGLVYQVFSIDATGRVTLDLLEELCGDAEGNA